jgi:radixin
MPGAKTMKVTINTMDAQLDFSILTNTTGKQLFDQVVKTIGLRELWYFGLFYKDSSGQDSWVKLNKKIKDQDLPKDLANPEFQFRAKFFPEDATQELIQDITVKLFYLQVKEAILNDSIYCPAEAAVLLASYAMQAKYGDAESRHTTDIQKDIDQGRVLPKRVREQHPTFTAEDWSKKVSEWHTEHRGLIREETMREYLKIAQDLDMYGVTYFPIKNRKGTDLYLGVDALGINVYERENKLTPRIGFPWSEISNISFNNRNFTIKPNDKKSPDFVIKVDKMKTNKNILAICMGNHELYLRRRKKDSIEVQQMRADADNLRRKRQEEKERIDKERKLREAMEQKARDLEERLNEAERQASERERQLREVEQENASLRTNLSNIQTDIERMEAERHELLAEKESLARAVSEGELTKEEYTRRMMEIQDEYKSVQDALSAKENEAQNLRENLEQTKEEKDAIATKLSEMPVPSSVVVVENSGSGDHHNNHTDHDIDDDRDEGDVNMASNEGVQGMDSELNRETAVSKDQNLSVRLLELSTDLNAARDAKALSANDQIHQSNVKAGRDKFKTLNLIRRGNTKSRVNEFEAM